jgi:hypothetical protein
LKRKRECIDFGPCANPPFKIRKTYSSKASTKPTRSILAKSKILAKNLAKQIPKPPYSFPLGIVVVSNCLSELIEGDHFTDDDEESNEEKRGNLKRKRECIDFGPCANLPFKSRKNYSLKVSKKPTKSIPTRSKVLAKNLAKSVPKPTYSLPFGVVVVSNGLSELIEGDYFTDDDVNKTIVTYILDVLKCPDGYMSSQIYKEVIKLPGWSFPLVI